jgi:hypothetical protein
LDLFCTIRIRLSSPSRKKATSSQDGCVSYLTKQTIAGVWHHPSSAGMTYPKSEIRSKDSGALTSTASVGFFGTTWTSRPSNDWAERLSLYWAKPNSPERFSGSITLRSGYFQLL